MSTRDYSDSQEKYISKALSGHDGEAKVQPNSGGTKFGGGDVHTDNVLIEAKICTREQINFGIRKSWIDKAKEQAFSQRKSHFALAFSYGDPKENYYVIDEATFKLVLDTIGEIYG